jgi:hypothetical protein
MPKPAASTVQESAPAKATNDATRAAQLAVWRARFTVQVCGTLSLFILFGLIMTGLLHAYLNADPIDRGDDQLFTFITTNYTAITLFHKYAGYALLFLLPATGLSLRLLGIRIGGNLGAILRWVGIGVLVAGFAAVTFSHVTGHLAGVPDEAVLMDERGQPTEEASSPNDPGSVSLWRRPAVRADAFDYHTHESVIGLIPAVLLLMVGAGIASAKSVRTRAGVT